MQKFTTIPDQDGLYWYYEQGSDSPRPVLVNQAKYQDRFKSFNGSEQRWLRDGEYLLGPQPEPVSSADSEKAEAIKTAVIEMLDGDDIGQYDTFDAFFAAMDTFTHYEQQDSGDSLANDRAELEAIYLDLYRQSAAEKANAAAIDMPSKQTIDKALDVLIEKDFWIDTLSPDQCYARIHDDNDGHTTATTENSLQVYIAQDADLHVFLPHSLESLRFRSYFGGGKSMRVRNALLVLAEAIRRDNSERP